MTGRNAVAKTGLLMMGALFAYAAFVARNGPVSELGPIGLVVVYSAVLTTFATVYIAARRARHAGSLRWLLACVFFWPAAYVYALCINREDAPWWA